MKKAHREYLNSIGITSETLLTAAEASLVLAYKLIGTNPLDIFVNDFLDEKKLRQYGDFECFGTENRVYCIGGWNTAQEQTLQLRVYSRITFLDFTVQDFDFQHPTPDSRLNIQFLTDDRGDWEYTATQNNALALYRLFVKHIRPKLLLQRYEGLH